MYNNSITSSSLLKTHHAWYAYISSIAAAPSMTMHDKAAPATAVLAPLLTFVELVELLPADHKHHVILSAKPLKSKHVQTLEALTLCPWTDAACDQLAATVVSLC